MYISLVHCQAQITHGDSIYLNNICKESTYISYWNNPGLWFHHTEISSVQNFYDQVDSSFIFNNDEFADCYRKIHTSAALELDTMVNQTISNYEIAHNNIPLFGNKNPFVKLKFNLNNKSAYSYALLDSSSKAVYNNDCAFVLISGTGTNQIKTILDGNGYHDLNCYVRNLLKPKGDVFIMSMPNEDHRAIYFNRKKASSLPSFTPPYLISYLNAANKSLGLNRLIETIAFIKFLKTQYKKVVVLGLSTGGKVALWATMLSEPDASLIASGYSILVDNDYNSQIINSMSYGNYLLVYDQDSTKSRISQLHTQILFTQAQNDNAVTQYDIDNKITENFLSSTGNTSFFSNMVNHAFPPCPVIDSFLFRVLNMAKVTISTDTLVCNKDSTVIRLHFNGKAPFNFQLFKNGVLYSAHYAPDTNFQITLLDEGQYMVKNIIDSAGTKGYTSDTFIYKKDLQPAAFLTKGSFVCDSSKTRLLCDFQGNSPFLLRFNRNNIADSILFTHLTDSAMLTGGAYQFVEIKDADNCVNPVSASMNLYDGDLHLNVGPIQYNCLTNTSSVPLSVAGLLPLTLTYYDSVSAAYRNKILSNFTESLDLDSGVYRLLTIKDSVNCIKMLDSTLLIHNEPLSLTYDTMTYYCDGNFATLPIHLKGKNNWLIQLEHNGIVSNLIKSNKVDSLHIQPGSSKIISITDGNNCTIKINDSMLMNPFKKLTANVFTGMFDCNINQRAIQLHASGNLPLQVYWHSDVQQFAGTFVQFPHEYLISPGAFAIDSILDSKSCKIQGIYDAQIVNDTIDPADIILEKFVLKTSYLSAQKYYWYLNDILYRETAEPYVEIERNGFYDVGIYNNNNCFLKTKKLKVDLGKMLMFPNPVDDAFTVMLQFEPEESVQYFITDISGKKVLSGAMQNGKNLIRLPEISRGIYMIHFVTNMNNIAYPPQRILKN
jgi:hypothetical protein